MNTAYAAALATMFDMISRSEERDLADSLLVEILATPPDDMLHVETVADANRRGIVLEAAALRRPMTDIDIATACVMQKYYECGQNDPAIEDGLMDMSQNATVQYTDIEICDEQRRIAVVLIDEFTGETCGILGFERGHGQIVFSFGDAICLAPDAL